ncbi:FAD-dependent monooxygenase [Roseibium litorale]|uniref:FAD-dependent monooxygenase n=1 Tax=Roseibium litorale TaxID=2803841 RepID=UPI001AD8F56D|nr:FAD-dependent monooxygenase [Roseibium litorale]
MGPSEMSKDPARITGPVLVAGAGIGGLTAALALARAGHKVIVAERSPELAEVGAGLQLSPNACHVLEQIGALDAIHGAGFEPETVRIRSARSGEDITRLPLGNSLRKRFGAPYLVVHRADLQKALFDTASKNPEIEFRFGHKVAGLEDEPDAPVRVRFETASGSTSIDAFAVIGADGVWSALRGMIPGHSEAKFTGRTAYRATVSSSRVPDDLMTDTGLWLGHDAHLVHYPVHGSRNFNIVALIEESWTEKTWSGTVDRASFLQHFSHWAPEVKALLSVPDTWLKWALCGVDGSRPWTHGRLALLGDAAHGMLPFAAQGAGMAIEDAAVLADCLKPDTDSPVAALKTYEARRKERVVKVQKTAVSNGKIYHLSGPMAFARDTVMRLAPPARLSARMDWIYGWKAPA